MKIVSLNLWGWGGQAKLLSIKKIIVTVKLTILLFQENMVGADRSIVVLCSMFPD